MPPQQQLPPRSRAPSVSAQTYSRNSNNCCCSLLTAHLLCAPLLSCALLCCALLCLSYSEVAELEAELRQALDDSRSAQTESLEELRDAFKAQQQAMAEHWRLQKQRMKVGRSVLIAALKDAARPLLDLVKGRSAAAADDSSDAASCPAVPHSRSVCCAAGLQGVMREREGVSCCPSHRVRQQGGESVSVFGW
jgi:hypothetical protein